MALQRPNDTAHEQPRKKHEPDADKAKRVTWLGDGSSLEENRVHLGGQEIVLPKGKAVPVSDEAFLASIANHPHFKVEG